VAIASAVLEAPELPVFASGHGDAEVAGFVGEGVDGFTGGIEQEACAFAEATDDLRALR
jgi:hypothetical protein